MKNIDTTETNVNTIRPFMILTATLFILFVLLGYCVTSFNLFAGTDMTTLMAIENTRNIFLTTAAWTLTYIGSAIAMIVEVLVAFLLFRVAKRPLYGWYIGLGTLGAFILEMGFKEVFDRTRPLVGVIDKQTTSSFPSGHATVSIFFYGFLIFLALLTMSKGTLRIASISICTILIIGIGWSRMYLGAHWLTDVLGGYLLGASWLFLVITHLSASIKKSKN